MSNQKQNGSIIAIITMMFLYAMIAFVTNLAAPIGVVMKNDPEVGGSNMLAMLGNFMNFFAYLFMGIPAGKMLTRIGYKKTALLGILVGFIGVTIQWISGFEALEGYQDNTIYLLGAFVSGLSVCLLNTVVNPMLNLLGGGGNRGNQLNLMGGTLNSLSGTLTPMLVGALIGTVTKETDFVQINLVLYIAMAVFASAFIALALIPIKDPEMGRVTAATTFEHTPWSFRHCTLGVIAIFLYVGVEVGIPGTLNFYIADTTEKGAGLLANAAAIGGFVAGTYWLLMLVGRLCSSFIADKVSSKTMMTVTNGMGMILILLAIFIPKTVMTSMPLFTGSSFEMTEVPVSAMLLVLCGLCTSIMWASIFNLATEGLGKYTAQASGIFMMMVVGGGVLPLIQNYIADNTGYMISYFVPLLAMAYMFWYALIGSKNVNKDIPVD
ncbi:MAG: MFS transporter [Prevotella sp.]|jgi:FHS family L-fucose permease-like MFS transporter|uniref:MFS transporter n=1 Tax=Prevotella sp. tf2-5 TaxID=1761889 RepID=UPI0008E08F17|nr:MFS transporter [Prevotella sp. tf2-5]MBR2244054.1 MFS transporter [Prevotella sp.]SFO85367.1 MFS transporter, FHS family, L-fucose permease [Prevotella sp. tf2-5]